MPSVVGANPHGKPAMSNAGLLQPRVLSQLSCLASSSHAQRIPWWISTVQKAAGCRSTQAQATSAVREVHSHPLPGPPQTSDGYAAWSDGVAASPLEPSRRVFCNRSLNMGSIKAIGFDMDYTLAQYKPETFEMLAHQQTKEKLVNHFGYPEEVLEFDFDWRYMIRGLTIDKKRGNVIKADRHKYVKIAYHGLTTQLSRQERINTYGRTTVRDSFDTPDYASIDTLFSLAEAHLFMQLVDLKDRTQGGVLASKEYAEMYRDTRAAVDMSHRDGSLKRAVAADPAKYIHRDPRLKPLLQMLRKSGRSTFIATNSLWDYTHVVLNFVLSGRTGDDKDMEWLELFDAVVCGCKKPKFFTEYKELYKVDPESGMLWNTDNGAPIVAVDQDDIMDTKSASSAPDVVHGPHNTSPVFQGGTYMDLHKMLDVGSGSEVLYIGDHIYGDILKSKKTLGWRTMLVVPELETELNLLMGCKGTMMELKALRQQRDALDDQIDRLCWSMPSKHGGNATRNGAAHNNGDGSSNGDSGTSASSTSCDSELDKVLENLEVQRDGVKARHKELLRWHHRQFHPVWGQLLKTGYQNSRIAHQIERFACLYTSHVSNMSFYSPWKNYRGRVDLMAHEEEPLLAGDTDSEDAFRADCFSVDAR